MFLPYDVILAILYRIYWFQFSKLDIMFYLDLRSAKIVQIVAKLD